MTRALVVGGSGEIGSAICRRLASDGLDILIHTSQRHEFAEQLAASLHSEGHAARAVQFDVTDSEQTLAALQSELEDGSIQIIVYCAGIHADAPMAGMRSEQWRTVVDVSLNGFFNVCQPLLLPMIRTRWGRVVAVTSLSGIIGNRGQTNYAAAKAGLHGAIKSLSLEIASRQITANAVAPGIIRSRMTEGVFDDKTIRELVPAQRAGQPEEVADLVAFLTSPQAGYITGQIIGINGGIA